MFIGYDKDGIIRFVAHRAVSRADLKQASNFGWTVSDAEEVRVVPAPRKEKSRTEYRIDDVMSRVDEYMEDDQFVSMTLTPSDRVEVRELIRQRLAQEITDTQFVKDLRSLCKIRFRSCKKIVDYITLVYDGTEEILEEAPEMTESEKVMSALIYSILNLGARPGAPASLRYLIAKRLRLEMTRAPFRRALHADYGFPLDKATHIDQFIDSIR